MPFPENPSLLAQIVAEAEDDAPRLVYADWLEENGDPELARFIRVQCQLASSSPAGPAYPSLLDQQDELLAALHARDRGLHLPAGLSCAGRPGPYNFHRGFSYFVGVPYLTDDFALTSPYVQPFCQRWPEALETTTLRGLKVSGGFNYHLPRVLATPRSALLSALLLYRNTEQQAATPGVATFLASLAPGSTRWFGVNLLTAAEATALAGAALPRLERFEAPEASPALSPEAIRQLARADWFGQLRHAELALSRGNASAGLASLAGLPRLHTFVSDRLPAEGLVAFAQAPAFPVLGRLALHAARFSPEGASALAGVSLPNLAALELDRCALTNAHLNALIQADWFAGLRVRSLHKNKIGDRGIASLAASPAASGLRVLRLGDNSFGPKVLPGLAEAFPSLTTLDLSSSQARSSSAADVARFLAGFRSQGLRHLNLAGWPVEEAGAGALAGNPAFASLVSLSLNWCRIGPAGARALFESPNLRQLVCLDLTAALDTLGDAPALLCDPALLPALRLCRLPDPVPQAVRERLAAARGGVFLWRMAAPDAPPEPMGEEYE